MPGGEIKTAPPLFEQAIEEFNARKFFECHETLEDLWNAEAGDLRRFYQGILQIGVGYYKIITRPNYKGALALLATGSELLRPFGPELFGIDVEGLIAAALSARQELERLGPAHIGEFDRKQIPFITVRRVDE